MTKKVVLKTVFIVVISLFLGSTMFYADGGLAVSNEGSRGASVNFTEESFMISSPENTIGVTINTSGVAAGEPIQWDLSHDTWIIPSKESGVLTGGQEEALSFIINWQDFNPGEIKRGFVLMRSNNGGTTSSTSVISIEAFNIYTYNDDPVIVLPPMEAKASSSYSNQYLPGNVTDGNEATIWGALAGNGPVWIYVDQGKVTNSEKVVIKWFGHYYATKYDIFVSNDLKVWSKAYTGSNNTPGTDVIEGNISCRYVGLYMRESNDIAYGISEIEVHRKYTPAVDIANLSLLGSTQPGAASITLNGDYVYMPALKNGIHVVDAADKTAPSFLGTLDTTGDTVNMVVANGYAYVANGYDGLKIYDVSNPADPQVVTVHEFPINEPGTGFNFYAGKVVMYDAAHIFVHLTKLFSGGGYSSFINVINVSDPASPVLVNQFALPDIKVADFAIKNGYAYVTGYYTNIHSSGYKSGFYIYDIKQLNDIKYVRQHYIAGRLPQITLDGNFAYVMTSDGLVQVFYIMQSELARVVSLLKFEDTRMANLYVYKNVCFVMHGVGMNIYDFRYKNNPELIYNTKTGSYGDALVQGDYLYLTEGQSGLMIFGPK